MSGSNHIRAVGREAAQGKAAEAKAEEALERAAAGTSAPLGDLDLEEYLEFEEEAPSDRLGWVAPMLAIAVILGWTGFYGWAMHVQLLSAGAADPAIWVRAVIDWSIPVLLVGVIWLIAMRNSRAEAARFGATAALLSNESAQLEERLTVVNRELSLAREFLASQSLELESLGRVASEKISEHAAELQQLIKSNGSQVDAIGSASETALGNMTRLRDDLPVVANSARDVSNQVGNAGRTAHEQLEKLVSGFERLNQFGSASENQVTALGKKVGKTLEGFEAQLAQIEGLVSGRFETLQEQAAEYREGVDNAETQALTALIARIENLKDQTRLASDELQGAHDNAMERLGASKQRLHDEVAATIEAIDQLDQQAVAGARNRIKELHEEAGRFDDMLAQRDAKFLEEMERRQAAFETREAQASEVLSQRLADLDEELRSRREFQSAETQKLVSHSAAMTEQLIALNDLITKTGEFSDAARANLAEGLGSLGEQLATKQSELAETEAKLSELTESGIRLLEIIQSSAQHSREELPRAIQSAASELESVEARAEALNGVMFRTTEHGNELSEYLTKTREELAETDSSIAELRGKLEEQSEDTLAKLQGLRSGFAKLTDESSTLATSTQETLRRSLSELEERAQSVFDTLDRGAREKIGALAGSISNDAVQALERSLRNESAETIGKLEQAAAHASGVGREATIQLRDQLARVNELTGNLEQRVMRARELAEEQVNNDFARRMALITDSLNSNAIDITSALAMDVTDTAWDAYLKGDRGIFTRRAVRLIDNGEAREIAELYQQDEAFKANVSRYIHDFEKMLRSMLSTRDGTALSVTILGSDMGKLYVLLAQAIERFRN